MSSLMSLSKLRFFTRVILVALVLHSCRLCRTHVVLVVLVSDALVEKQTRSL